MFTQKDLIDLIVRTIDQKSGERSVSAGAVKRSFISDWEMRKMLRPGQKTVIVPRGSIISPLSQDWLQFEGIEVISDESK